MTFDFLKNLFKKKDKKTLDPKEGLNPIDKTLTNPFVSKAIDFISAGQTLPEAEKYSQEQLGYIKKLPKLAAIMTGLDTSARYQPIKTAKEVIPAALGLFANIGRVPTAIQKAIAPKPGKTRAESAMEGLVRPDLTPAGYLGGEARKLFPTPKPEEGLITPSNITAALMGTAGELASYELGTGALPGRVKNFLKSIKTKGAFRSGEELVDNITNSIIKKRSPTISKGKDLTAELNKLRPKVRKAILGSEKPTEILKPGIGEELLKKQTPKKLTSDWVKSVKKALATESGQAKIIKNTDKLYHGGTYKIGQKLKQKSGYYPGLYLSSQKGIAFEHGDVSEFNPSKDLKLYDMPSEKEASKLKEDARKAGYEITKGSGTPESKYLEDLGYDGIQRKWETILFKPEESIKPTLTEKPVIKVEPEKALTMTEEEFLSFKGASRMEGAEPALHRTPGGFPKGVREKHLARVQEAMKKNIARREELRKEYAEKVEAGEIITPNREENLIKIARGDKDLESTQAARRLLKKKGLEWEVKPPPKPPTKPPTAEAAPSWDDDFEEVKYVPYIESTPEETKALKEINKEAKAELSKYINTIKGSIIGKIKNLGSEEERLMPHSVFASKLQANPKTLDEAASEEETAQALSVLGYDPGYQGLKDFIYEHLGQRKQTKISTKRSNINVEIDRAIRKLDKKKKDRLKKAYKTYLQTEKALKGKPEQYKTIIRKLTGQPQIEPKTISEKAALERSLKRQEQVSKKALKVGVEEGKLKVRKVLAKAKERKELSGQVKKLIRSIQTKPTQDLPIEYKDAIEDIKSNIDFEKVRLSNILKREKASKLVGEDVRDAAKELAAINAEDMTLADLQEVEDLVSQIYHSGVHEHRFLSNEIKIDFDKSVIKASEQLKPKKPGKTELPLEKILNEETFASRTKRVAKQYQYENRRPEAIFEELDNFKEGGVFTEVAWKPTIEGIYKYQTELDGLVSSVRDITQKIKGQNVGKKEISIPGIKKKITIADAMGIYAHSQNSANKAHLEAMGFSEAMINSVLKQLKPQFKKVVDEVIDFLSEELFPKIDATNVKMKGTHLEQVERYFPIMNLLDTGSVESVKMDLKAREQYKRSGIAKSFTKQREVADKSNKAFKKLDFFSTLYQHLNNASYYMNMSEPIRDASKFLFDPNVKASIRESYGDALNRVNKKWIDDITKNRLPMATNTFEAYADVIGKNAVMYFIGSSLSVAMKQPASFMQGAGMIGGANAMNGLLQMTTNPMAVLRFVSNRSPLIRTRVRLFSQERDFQEIFGGKSAAGRFGAKDIDLTKGIKAAKQKVGEVSMMPIQIMDMITVLSIWKGDYDAQIAKNISSEEARKHADHAIRRTQPMGGIINLPESFRGNVLMRQITRLKNQPSQNVNLMYDAIKKFSRSEKEFKDFKEFGGNAFWWFLAPAVLWGMLSRKRVQRDKKEVSHDLLNFGLGGLPIFGQLLSAFITPYYESDLLNSFLAKIKGARSGRSEVKKLKSTIEAAGIGLGVPGGASVARLFFGKDIQQKILGGESQITRLKYDYKSALQIEDKKERLAKIKEVNRNAKSKGLSVSKISKDGKSWLRNDLRDKYKIEGNIDDIKNLRIIRKMPKEKRDMLIRTYSASTQEKLREKL